jgi:hypothetical protein
MKPSELLDLVKAATGLETDYQFMKKFGFSQTGVSNWRTNRGFPKNSVLIIFAEIIHISPAMLMIYGLKWRERGTPAGAELDLMINAIHHATFDESDPIIK